MYALVDYLNSVRDKILLGTFLASLTKSRGGKFVLDGSTGSLEQCWLNIKTCMFFFFVVLGPGATKDSICT
jgi:hypothetical protein